jgi:hypothetical protein
MTADASGTDRLGDCGAVSRSSHRSAHNATSTFTGTDVYGNGRMGSAGRRLSRHKPVRGTDSDADADDATVGLARDEAALPVVVATII